MITPPTVVICAWCNQMWRPMDSDNWGPITTPLDASNASHGLCKMCFVQEMKKFLNWRSK